MRISKRLILLTAALMVVIGISGIVGLTLAVNRFWPTVRGWASMASVETVGGVLKQLSGSDGTKALDRLAQLGVQPATLASVGLNPELARLLSALGQTPELGLLLRDGAYQEAVREAIRQKAGSISQIQLDRTLSPETRDQVVRVQKTLQNSPLYVAGAELLNPKSLDLLEGPTFAKLMQDAKFLEYLARPKAVKEPE